MLSVIKRNKKRTAYTVYDCYDHESFSENFEEWLRLQTNLTKRQWRGLIDFFIMKLDWAMFKGLEDLLLPLSPVPRINPDFGDSNPNPIILSQEDQFAVSSYVRNFLDEVIDLFDLEGKVRAARYLCLLMDVPLERMKDWDLAT